MVVTLEGGYWEMEHGKAVVTGSGRSGKGTPVFTNEIEFCHDGKFAIDEPVFDELLRIQNAFPFSKSISSL